MFLNNMAYLSSLLYGLIIACLLYHVVKLLTSRDDDADYDEEDPESI